MHDYIQKEYVPKKPAKSYLMFITVFLFIGIGLIVGTSVICAQTNAKLKTFVVTTGIVIDYKVTNSWGLDNDSSITTAYAEIAQFEVNGKIYTVTNGLSSTQGVKRIGDAVQIAYNPENPDDCIFITSNNKFGIIFAIVLGCLFTLVSGVLLCCYCIQYKEWKKIN